MSTKPIGVFDSGLGGLTTVRELRKILPGENIVYFGDTGRVPYGTRGREIILAYARQDIAFLLSRDVKAVLAACGTVSSILPPAQMAGLPVGYLGVVEATAAAAVNATHNKKIGIIGTEATIASRSYQNAIQALAPAVQSTARACPLFVPLVENGHFDAQDPLVTMVAEEYLAPIKAAGVDTVIMGCTHYPLLAGALREQLGYDITLVDAGREAAHALQGFLVQNHLLSGAGSGGKVEYYVSDDPARFDALSRIFMGVNAGDKAQQINIEEFAL